MRAPEPDGPSYDDVPYDDYGYEEAPVVASPVPEDPFSELSAEDRAQLRAERNLLALLASDPDRFRPYADRIATFGWADARHQAIAWAILATPEGTSAAEAVSVAARACPDAPRILSSSSFSSTSSWDAAKNVEFVVGEAEIRSLDRRISQLTASLGAMGADESREALRELSQLRARRDEVRASQPLE